MFPALLIPPLVLFAFAGAVIFAVMGRQVSEGVVGWLRAAGKIGELIAGPAGAVAVKLTQWITHNVGAVFGDLERLTVTWFSAVYQYLDLVITNALEWPLWLWKFQRWLLFVELPKLYHAIPIPAVPTFPNIWKRLKAIEQALTRLGKLAGAGLTGLIAAGVWRFIRPYWHALQWLGNNFHVLTAVLPRAIPIPHVPTFPNIWKRIRSLERKVAPAAIAAAVIVALGRLGLGFIRCGNVKKAGKRICGLDTNLLDSLLLDTLAVFGVVSVVEFAHGLRTIEDEAVGILHHLIREFPAPTSTASG